MLAKRKVTFFGEKIFFLQFQVKEITFTSNHQIEGTSKEPEIQGHHLNPGSIINLLDSLGSY